MNSTKRVSILSLLVCGSLMASPAGAVKRAAGSPRPSSSDAAAQSADADAAPAEIAPGAKVVEYGDKDVITIHTKIRYTTLIILPKNEQILDFTCGDKEYWVVNGNQNFAYVKPAKGGAQTNLNLVTASGNVYSFVLAEVSETRQTAPDLKVFVELKDDAMISAAGGAPRFVPAQVVDDYKQQVQIAKDETRQVKQAEQTAVDRGISKFLMNVRFPYRFEAGKKPFYVRAMYNDDKFTYIQARPEETPTLYEIQDGKPNLIDFEYKDGVYEVHKILDRGYLAIGKQKLAFTREE
jgi:type IV secretory pathway VirB9-like protein